MVSDLQAALLRFLPPEYTRMADLLVAFPGALAQVETTRDDLLTATTVEGAEGIWLTLIAHGYGLDRATAEPDAALRTRLRTTDGAVTRPSLLAAVDALLAPYTDTPAEMIEWFEGPFSDVDAWGDSSYVSDGPNSFLILVPLIGAGLPVFDSYADSAWSDIDAWAGSDASEPIYSAIVAEIERKRPAGTRWALVIRP